MSSPWWDIITTWVVKVTGEGGNNPLDLFELVKTVGALVAIPTALFVVYDRIVRSRPLVSLTIKDHPLKHNRFLTIKNVGKTDIAIRSVTVWPAIYGTAKGNYQEEIYQATIGDRFRSLVGPGETAELQLIAIHQGQRYHEDSDHWVCIAVIGARPLRSGCPRLR